MAAPTFVAAGALAIWQSGAAVTLSKTTCTAGNLLIIQVVVDGTDTTTLSAITNIQNLAGTTGAVDDLLSTDFILGNPGAAEMDVFLGRVTANGTCSVGIASGGVDLYGVIWEFTNVSTGTTFATVIENAAQTFPPGSPDFLETRGTSATISDHDVTTNGVDRLAINLIGVDDDNQADFDTEAFTGQTGGTWVCGGGFGSATGTDGALGLQHAAMAAAGTIGGGTRAMAASDNWGVVGFALIGTTADTKAPPFAQGFNSLRLR